MLRKKSSMHKMSLTDLMYRSDRGLGKTSGISGVLSALFVQFMIKTGITGERWRYLIDDFARKEGTHNDNRRDIASIRGNLNKEFLRNTMTWKVFVKAMMFLKFRKFRIIIVAQLGDGSIVEASVVVDSSTADHLNTDREYIEKVVSDSEDMLNPVIVDYSNKKEPDKASVGLVEI